MTDSSMKKPGNYRLEVNGTEISHMQQP